jgi:hypothetical protein
MKGLYWDTVKGYFREQTISLGKGLDWVIGENSPCHCN